MAPLLLLFLARSLDAQHLKPIARAAARQRKAPLRKAPPAPRRNGQNITRYLLVSQPRSGSTWVLSKFAQHRCVLSRGENGLKAWAYAGGETCATKASQKAVDRCFDAYFAVAQRTPESGTCGELAVGGKVWGSQMLGSSRELRPALLRYLQARRVVVVLLFRVNALDHVLSNEMVVATDGGNNRMHCRVGSDFFGAKDRAGGGFANNPCVDATKVRIDPAKVITKAREKRSAFEALRRAWGLGTDDQFAGGLSDTGGFPVLYLPYETLKGYGRLARDLWATAGTHILGVNLPPGVDPGDADAIFGPDVTVKRIRRAKKDVISNYEELRKVLVANDLAALLDDH